jgi:hypothetical protein
MQGKENARNGELKERNGKKEMERKKWKERTGKKEMERKLHFFAQCHIPPCPSSSVSISGSGVDFIPKDIPGKLTSSS